MLAAESMISSNQQLAESTQLLAGVFQEFNGPKLAAAISEAVRQTMEKEVVPPLEALPKAVQELREIKEKSSQELIDLITASIKEDVVKPMTEQNERVAQVVSTTARSVDELVAQLSGVMTELSSTTTTLNEFQRDTLVKLQEFAESLRTILSQFKDDTEGALNRVSQEINQALQASIEGMGNQREAFERSAQQAASAFEQQNDSLRSIGSESSQLMDEAKQNLLEGLGTIDDKVRTMSAVTQQELERFRIEYQENLTGFFQQQENLLEQTLGKQREGLAGVVADFRKVFEEEHQTRREQYAAIQAQYEQLQKGVALVQELVEAVGLNKSAAFDQLNDTARAVSAQVGQLRKSYAEASERFNKVTEQMPEAMTSYFERARGSNEKFFEQFDDSAAKVHGKLAEAANLLVVAMQTIEARQLEAATELE
jgi:ABC-type transporter Mla subunit MlaD